jgi:uncharacterized membrane protein
VSEVYNQFSGRRVDRVQALADGVFAVAMTLLVLDVRLPGVQAQTLYAVAALLTFAGPVVAIVALGAVQLFFIVSPRLPFRV